MLAPFRRAVFNIPFLYQKISSTSPVQVVISANSSLAVVHMDGSTDWTVVGRALLAWTGQTISIKPTRDRRAVRNDPSHTTRLNWLAKSLAKRGNSEVTGRGLLAITGQGSVYQVVLAAEEKYLLHPRYVYLPNELSWHQLLINAVMSLHTPLTQSHLCHTGYSLQLFVYMSQR